MERVFNFSAGPSQMPFEVLVEAQKELLSYGSTGTSVMEMSHRSEAFEEIISGAKENLIKLMNIPTDYEVLFLQGGASLQFSMVPMNLLQRGEKCGYALSGNFAGKAAEEAMRWGEVKIVASSKDANYTYISDIQPDDVPSDLKYVHITGNNTIFGTTYYSVPNTGGVPLVADWSSAILGKEINVSDYDLIYAGAQKNMGPAGLTVVIIKKSLLDNVVDPLVPTMLQYKVHADKDSMYNTPPCWSIYMASLMFKWVMDQGGVKEMERRNCEKATLLYDYIDNSSLFNNDVRKKDRSIMNATFVLPNKELTEAFVKYCAGKGIVNIKGHKLVGGCRASIYNGMPLDGVRKLVSVMKEFEKNV
ncbi:MAG: 3-phosphoserine/phosphohydroxythreonine transaminase [Bacillota bacterium]|nr:3-phosphoserine/phosphohydroxythreonine transaminase [Bacillota bacterium]